VRLLRLLVRFDLEDWHTYNAHDRMIRNTDINLHRVNHSFLSTTLRYDALVHDLVPIFASEDLEYSQQCYRESVKIGFGRASWQIELAAK